MPQSSSVFHMENKETVRKTPPIIMNLVLIDKLSDADDISLYPFEKASEPLTGTDCTDSFARILSIREICANPWFKVRTRVFGPLTGTERH